MTTIKEVRKYAYDLVSDSKSQFHMLSDAEKCTLSGMIMKSTEKIHLWEYITEADFKDELPNLLSKWLETGDNDYAHEILNTLKNNAINYASNKIIVILDEQDQEYKFNRNEYLKEREYNRD